MTPPLFDLDLRVRRRDRAFATGPDFFLHRRAFTDLIDRLSAIRRPFERTLLVGCPAPEWAAALAGRTDELVIIEPSPIAAKAAGVAPANELDLARHPAASFDLIVAAGTLDTVDPLPLFLHLAAAALRPDGLLAGWLVGGDSLPRLRAAMHAADGVAGAAAAHVHPRIAPAALAGLLGDAGLVMPVVDVDRVNIAYSSLDRLVADLRGMGATNVLAARPRTPLGRAALRAARAAFLDRPRDDGKAVETFDLLHFAAWSPPTTGTTRD